MKRFSPHGRLASAFVLSVLFASCMNFSDLKTPEKISVSMNNAGWSVPLGTGTAELSKHLNVSTLQENLLDNQDDDKTIFSVYDYNPKLSDDEVQQFILTYQMEKISLGGAGALKDLKLDEALNNGLKKEFTIPAVDKDTLTFRKEIDIDMNKIITDNFSFGGDTSVTVYELGNADALAFSTGQTNPATGKAIVPDVTISFDPAFEIARFSTGSLVFTFDKPANVSSDFHLPVTASLHNADGFEIANSGTPVDIGQGGIISIDLSNVTLSSTLTLEFAGEISGGTAGNALSYTITVGFNDPQIAYVSGLSMENDRFKVPVAIDDIDISNVGDYLLSATITDGDIDLSCALPTGWSGVDTSKTTIAFSGGLELADNALTDASDVGTNYLLHKTANLSGTMLNPSQPIQIAATVHFTLNNATLDFESGTTDLYLNCEGEVKAVGDAKVKVSKIREQFDDADLSIEKDFSASSYIKEVKVTELSVTGGFTTTLDAESLAIDIGMTSEAFEITEGMFADSIDIMDSEDTLALIACSLDNCENEHQKNWSGLDLSPETTPTIDFAVTLDFVAEKDENDNEYIAVNSLALGGTYEIAANLDLDFDWESVTIDISAADFGSKEGTVETGLDINELVSGLIGDDDDEDGGAAETEKEDSIEDIVNKIAFSGIESYIYVTAPGLSEKNQNLLNHFNGSVWINYRDDKLSDEDEPYKAELVNNKDLTLLKDMVDFDALVDETNNWIGVDLFSDTSDYPYSVKTNDGVMCEVINKKPADITIGYAIGFNGEGGTITLKKEDIAGITSTLETIRESEEETEASADDADIAVTLTVAIVLPLKLTITEDIHINDVLGLFDTELDEDLLKRDDPSEGGDSDDDTITKITELIQKVEIGYLLNNNMGLSLTAGITAKNKNGNEYFSKEIVVGEPQTLTISDTEMDRIRSNENYPFIPKFTLDIAAGDIKLKRNAYFSANATAGVVVDGSYTLKGDDDE